MMLRTHIVRTTNVWSFVRSMVIKTATVTKITVGVYYSSHIIVL
nr:unnamed protein product [Callosobruchus analis]